MDQLLNKNEPEARLGGPSFAFLKNHLWFEHVNWEDLYQRKLEAPLFDRSPNVDCSLADLTQEIEAANNCREVLDEHLHERISGDSNTFTNW